MDPPMALGEATAIEPGPWHYGADYVTVYFRARPDVAKRFVPRPFEAGDGLGMAYVCEIVSVSASNPDSASDAPERTVYREAAFGFASAFEGRKGVFFPTMWVDTEWSLLRGLLNGYSKRLADRIQMTRLHPLNVGLRPLGPGSKMSGFCSKGPDRGLWLRVTVDRSGQPSDLLGFGATFGMRAFPRTDPSQDQVSEAVEILKTNSRAADVWLGKGELSVAGLEGLETLFGAVYRSGFTISGSRVLQKL